MLNVDVEPLNSKLLNNMSAHSDYLKHTQEEAVILRKIVEQGKSQNPLNAYLDSACYPNCSLVFGLWLLHAMTGNRSQFTNFVNKILGTVKFGNDHMTKILGSGPTLHEMTSATISLRLVPNTPPSTPFVPPSRSDWDILFQPLFDELLTPPPSVDYLAPKVIALIAEVVALEPATSTGSPSSNTVDQDPPSDPFFGIPILEIPSDQSSSTYIICTIVHPDHQISKHNSKWTKDHPLENIIDQLARPVSIRLQLHEQARFCYYDAFLTSVKPKTYKDALTQSCWIEAMQEELNEFERLGVWKLVPRPDKVIVITLKWIYKVKLDELGGLQISQSPRGIFINRSKYALEFLKKYGFDSYDPVDTPMVEKSKLDKDKEGKAVDPSHDHGMIGTLLYLTASRPYLQFPICICARYQARPNEEHLHAVKKIF
nr:retrovirus-related Pol polyprotein from transposon TNT 1-94 [Tanacetum cinerariifolium]